MTSTSRHHVIAALVTVNEGYHNLHPKFPLDGTRSDTKWFMLRIGLVSHLKVFPENEVQGLINEEAPCRPTGSCVANRHPRYAHISWDAFQH